MANWKIRDIAPPKKEKGGQAVKEERKLEPEPPRQKKRKRKVRLLLRVIPLLLVLAAVGVGVVHVFFAKAEVRVWPVARELSLQERVVAVVGAEAVDIEEKSIPARTLTGQKEATRLFEASNKTVKENRASGTIRVFNANSTNPLTLIANTRFVSEEGKLFRAPERITIPGGKEQGGNLEPGFIDIEVRAAEPGEDYNIGPSNFSLPGLSGSPLYTTIYAKSTEPMSGGSEREVLVVSNEDIEQAKESLEQELSASLKAELLSKVPEHLMASPDSVVIDVVESSTPVKEGAELDQFNVSVSLEGTAYLFPRSDVQKLVDSVLAADLQEGERVKEERTTTSFTDVALDPEQDQVSMKLQVDSLAYLSVDPTELKIRLRGKSEQEALSVLMFEEKIERSSLSLWPFWISSVPGNVDRLEIETIIDPVRN